MKKEKTVRTYQRRTKRGKIVTVKQHTAKYDAAEKAKEASKKKGAGNELEAKMKRLRLKELIGKELPEEEVEKKVLDEDEKGTKKKGKIRPVGTGTNGPEPKKTSKEKASKTATSKFKKTESEGSNSAFTAAEFKEWYHGTGSAADKKVAKALRAQLGRAGYRKLEDEAIDNYSSRGHLSMFKRVSGGSETKTKASLGGKAGKSTASKTSKNAASGTKSAKVASETPKKSHKAVPKSSYKKYKEDPAYERRLEKDPKFASSEAVKGAKAELRGYGKQTPTSIARQYGKDSKEYKGYMKLYSTPVPKDPKKAAVRNAVLQGFGRAGDDTCRDLLVANGYPHTHAYSKGVKEITALAKKYGIDW